MTGTGIGMPKILPKMPPEAEAALEWDTIKICRFERNKQQHFSKTSFHETALPETLCDTTESSVPGGNSDELQKQTGTGRSCCHSELLRANDDELSKELDW